MHLVAIYRETVAALPGTGLTITNLSSKESTALSNTSPISTDGLSDYILADLKPGVRLAVLGRVRPSGVCGLVRIVEVSQNKAIFEGIGRCRVSEFDRDSCQAKVILLPYGPTTTEGVRKEFDKLKAALKIYPNIRKLLDFQGIPPSFIVDAIASVFPISKADKFKILEEVDVKRRLILLASAIIDSSGPTASGQKSVSKGALGNSIKAPKADQDEDEELAAIVEKLKNADLGAEGMKIVNREISRLKRMNSVQAEYQVCFNYLETLADIPWGKFNGDKLDSTVIQTARAMFDEDHYGLNKVKQRLVEYLAVLYLQKLQNEAQPKSEANVRPKESLVKPPILLLVGPPGVGKTSLAKSVAKVMGRDLYRISLGGVRDEAELRGHRRTYVGAMPGIVIQGIRRAGTMNPVIVLDEIDKLSKWSGAGNGGGDPSAALLEILDPEQNYSFRDHYVNFPVDLSKVVFIATANSLENIPRPLMDRMEVIEVAGYTYLEKMHIARKYLIPKQANANGNIKVNIDDDALMKICTRFTRESGVRELERQIGTICRGVAVDIVQNQHKDSPEAVKICAKDLPKYLGVEKYTDDLEDEENVATEGGAGVVNGLAYMGSGVGGLLTFEARLVPLLNSSPGAQGQLKLTGQLGEVISESAHIAFSWVKTTVPSTVKALEGHDIHLHAPAGAIPKDGPSAGVAMAMTILSLLLNRPVSRKIAMTGEITLRGKVLPVGGIKEKLLGAHLAGVHTVLLPAQCMPIVQSPECAGLVAETGLKIQYARQMADVLSFVWQDDSLVLTHASL